uniref:Alternative protein MRPS14 n=1 Tax=Homo sapiens TaxID=9606 RepID=L8E935_HUMAN|nr:alternative protein MRPS14 [Homo sapiens]
MVNELQNLLSLQGSQACSSSKQRFFLIDQTLISTGAQYSCLAYLMLSLNYF